MCFLEFTDASNQKNENFLLKIFGIENILYDFTDDVDFDVGLTISYLL